MTGWLRVNGDRLSADLAALAEISAPGPGVTRRAFSPEDARARAWLSDRMAAAGLTVRRDGAGSLIGRLGGAGPAIVIGSHIDSVPSGGALDGCYGVLAGLECVRRLGELGRTPPTPLEIVAFADEEGRFLDLFGSRAMAGALSAADIAATDLAAADLAAAASDEAGETLAAALAAEGLSAETALAARRADAEIRSYVELHIEQGPALDADGVDIGLATGVAGIARCAYRFEGQANHAGATPMAFRRDALRGAAAFMTQAYELLARAYPETRMTFGALTLEPNVLNVVPGAATLGQEIRDASSERADAARRAFSELAARVAADHGLSATASALNDDPSAPLDAGLRATFSEVCAAGPLRWRTGPSWASHDCQAMAPRWPAALIFVPSRGGVSHHPDEYSTPAQLAAGADLLLNWLCSRHAAGDPPRAV